MNQPAKRSPHELILEGIVTTKNVDGSTNVSPMGPVVDRAVNSIRLRPFQTSTTFQNLKRSRVGVFHVTDDVVLLAKAAIGGQINPAMHPCESFDGMVISGACRWYAFEVHTMDDSADRVELSCHVVKRGRIRDFLGWNRAMHAVLEAAILATRVQLLPADEIALQLKPLATIVQKTSGEQERIAFRIITDFIAKSK